MKQAKRMLALMLVLATLLCALPVTVSAAEEGTTMGNAVHASFGEQYYKEWTRSTYRLNHYVQIIVPQRGVITIRATKPVDSEGEYGRLKFTLYDSDGESIWGNDTYHAKSDAKDHYELYVGLNPGIYYLTINSGFYVTSGTIRTTYSIDFQPNVYCEVEPNNSMAQATALSMGKTYTCHYGQDWSDEEECDYYKFELKTGKTYKIAIGNMAKFGTTLLYLIDPQGDKTSITWSLNKVDSEGKNYILYTAQSSGTYYLLFDNYSRQQYTYTVSVSEQIQKLSTPALPTLTAAANGVIINWSKVNGAAKYRVFRKTGSGAWQSLGDTAGTSWTDRTAEKGKTYSYTICCVSKDGKTLTSDYNQTGKSILYYIAIPALPTLKTASNGISISWNKVAGAQKYRIFRKTGNGSWVKLGDASGTAWVDRTAQKGVTYTYTIRCVSADGKTYTSDYNRAGKSILYYLATPSITKLQVASNGVSIQWNRVNGAAKYRIYRKTGSGNWVVLGDASGTAWVDRTAQKGVTYTYTVRCVTSDGKTYTSSFNSTGWTIKR